MLITQYYSYLGKWLDCEPVGGFCGPVALLQSHLAGAETLYNQSVLSNPNIFWQHSYSGLYTILEMENSKPYSTSFVWHSFMYISARYLKQPRLNYIFWKVISLFPILYFRLLFTSLSLLLWPHKSSTEQYFLVLFLFFVSLQYYTPENLHFQNKHIKYFLAHMLVYLTVTSNAHANQKVATVKSHLWLGGGQSEPYSWTCMPKKHKSTPSISSKAKRALVRYGKDSAISPLSTNLYNSCWRKRPQHFIQIRFINSNCVWAIVDPQRRKGEIIRYLAFMPGLTSTVLSEAWTTLTVTSPDSGWFCRLRKSFTRFSRKVPSLVDGNPKNLKVKSSVVTKVQIYYYQS